MIKDPICGMTVDPRTAAFRVPYRGQTYFFCSQMCRMMFIREPEKHVTAEATESVERKP